MVFLLRRTPILVAELVPLCGTQTVLTANCGAPARINFINISYGAFILLVKGNFWLILEKYLLYLNKT
ncbi:hypothetical protein A3I42_02705 [Candidatus Uhrbacteria bacterium RIFCSPLOWO2_02_FULL_49_11]|uniref:Uncharacterized protein n=1 Tax=Candidatus Uhrbacteria bacterium RIFCSPLOWO2_02_FULL_49_11 TaxID=1802409 RepID=A0A1F7VCU0_9BACT|nr:MAG: hypothetical protein A3I42_02705 [Candidatus Uhrbacteria bacterium RIFCSPLOWO2_02_FULL_49_11]